MNYLKHQITFNKTHERMNISFKYIFSQLKLLGNKKSTYNVYVKNF